MKRFFCILTTVLVIGNTAMAAENLFSAATTSMTCWSMPGWQGEANTSFATWQNGVLTVNVPGDCGEQWQCQVKLQTQGIVLDADKMYVFRCNTHANRAVPMVTIKLFDNQEPPLSMDNQYSLAAGGNTVQTPSFRGGDTGNGIIVLDFGFAKRGDVITVTDIVLEEMAEVPPTKPTDPEDGYHLVWNADFVQNTLNTGAWNIEVNGDGGGNQELQYYCEKGVSLGVEPTTGKHCLILTATKENYMGKTCTSGRVNSLGKVYFQYGKVEARIFFPNTANGLWPAFWMMGNDFAEVGWPACGETDIVELGHQNGIKAGTQDRFFNGASHWGPQWDQHYQYAQDITNSYSVEGGFHTFTCIWDAERVAMYVDLDRNPNAVPYYQMTIPKSNEDNAPGKYFHKPNFIIFNLAVGGHFPGIYDINGITALQNGPRSMYIDWLRIYQKGDAGETFSAAVASDPIEQAGTAVINTGTEQGRARKVLRDGQLLIEADGCWYNIWGQQVNIK